MIFKETRMHNFSNQSIQKLIQEHNWRLLDDYNKVLEVYNYIQNDILFGYNLDDSLKASDILKDKIGQCNTKGTLFMALLRALNIPCRVHGFYITKNYNMEQ